MQHQENYITNPIIQSRSKYSISLHTFSKFKQYYNTLIQ